MDIIEILQRVDRSRGWNMKPVIREVAQMNELNDVQMWSVMARLRECQEQLKQIHRSTNIDLQPVIDKIEVAIFAIITNRKADPRAETTGEETAK
jgi:hypothetical protein